ncbi:hypothetical protein [Bauldia sp.]|uniref:hypothetical protein n=1 Tax=Bauldia sp. TaxID=2575872 RepID=UPI003BAB2DFC
MDRLRILWKLFASNRTEVTPEEIAYFRKHPDEIDELTVRTNLHLLFLIVGMALGTLLIAFSKLIKFDLVFGFLGAELREFVVDLIFEIGVALVGAGVTAYLLVVLLRAQQRSLQIWRKNIRQAIADPEGKPDD